MVKLLRKDLEAHLTGSATFVEDLDLPDALLVGFLRSPEPHAAIESFDARAVERSHRGALAFAMSDLRDLISPNDWREYPLADEEVAYQGHPVAAVAAPDQSQLEDCIGSIKVGYRSLPAVLGLEDAAVSRQTWLSGATSNVIFERDSLAGDPESAMRNSPHKISLEFRFPRWSPYPLEGKGVAVELGRDETTVYSTTQAPHVLQHFLAESVRGAAPVRVVQAAVGGAFGGKMFPYPEELVSYLVALKTGRNVKWVPTPEEKIMTITHRPGQIHRVRMGYDSSGRILALEDRATVDAGAFLGGPTSAPLQHPGVIAGQGTTAIDQTLTMITGPYDIPDVSLRVRVVATNRVPAGPARGSGGMIATFILERAIRQIAYRLALDQFSVRSANLIKDSSAIHNGPFGLSVPPARFLEILEAARDAERTRAIIRRASSGRGRKLKGFGVSFYLAESAPPSKETVRLELSREGKLLLYTSVAPTGTGSERTLASIVSKKLLVPSSAVEVRVGDTGTSRDGIGTTSSRSIVYAGSASLLACDLLVEELRRLLSRSASGRVSVSYGAGVFRFREDGKGRTAALLDLAREMGTAVSVDATYRSETPTFSSGCHLALVEVDRWTGAVKVSRHLAFDDLGTVFDSSAVASQLEGAVVQSLGEALDEDVSYDRAAKLETRYRIPGVGEAPKIHQVLLHLTKSQHVHGGRGAGEAGRIGSLPAIVNAIEDAISKDRPGAFIGSIPVSPASVRSMLSAPRELHGKPA